MEQALVDEFVEGFEGVGHDLVGVAEKKLAAPKAPSLTPWQLLEHLRKLVLVDVEFETRDGRLLTLPRITIPEKEQAALLMQLGWTLPLQPPPRIRSRDIPDPEN